MGDLRRMFVRIRTPHAFDRVGHAEVQPLQAPPREPGQEHLAHESVHEAVALAAPLVDGTDPARRFRLLEHIEHLLPVLAQRLEHG